MIARAIACVAVAGALLAAIAIVRAQAHTAELARELGPALLAYAGATRDEGQRTLLVNGAPLHMRTGVTSDSIDTVLARQRAACGPEQALLPVLQWRSAAEGVVGCAIAADSATLSERLQALVETGDAAALGELRVTWVMASGERERRYVEISARDARAIAQMFPAQGDAPGQDAPGLPRPPGARRVLSAAQQGAAPMLVAYHSELALEELTRRYRQALEARGSAVEQGPRVQGGDGPGLLVRAATSVHLVLLARDERGALAVIVPLDTQPGA